MARLKLTLPEKKIFSTNIFVQIGHINYGAHLGNDSVLTLCHEARLRFLKSHGWSELDVDGQSLIMSDSQVMYRGEAFHGDELEVDLFIDDINEIGFDLYYLLTRISDSKEIARCKTGMAFFDYEKRKLGKTPPSFQGSFT